MKYSHKLSDAIHILAYVEIYQDGDLSSQSIAGSIESNASLVRRLMSFLVKAGLLESRPGTIAPKLARPAEQISVLDVYQALDIDQQLLHIDEKTNPQCLVGANIQSALNDAYDQVQKAAEDQMAQIKLASIIADILANNAQGNA